MRYNGSTCACWSSRTSARLAEQVADALAPRGTPSTAPATASGPISSARPSAYDAVVLDLGLPKIDGLTLLRRWRDAGVAVPVLVLTARGSWHEKVQGIDGGADDYVAKPFQMEEVLARLRALIRRASGQVGAGARVRRPSRSTRASARVTRGRRARQADEPRVPRAVVPDAPPRTRRLAGGAERAHLRAGLSIATRTPSKCSSRGCGASSAPDVIETVRGLGYRMSERVDGALARSSSLRRRAAAGRSGSLGPARRRAQRCHAAESAGSPPADARSSSRTRRCSARSRASLVPRRACCQVRRGVSAVQRLRAAAAGACATARSGASRAPIRAEVQPLVDDLNALLEHREQTVARALAKAGDLAHGLKTPLARARAGGRCARATAGHARAGGRRSRQQVETMRRQVDYHLAHARAAASGATPGARCASPTSADGARAHAARLHAERRPGRSTSTCASDARRPRASAKTSTRCSATCSTTPASGRASRVDRRGARGRLARPSDRGRRRAGARRRRCARRCCSAACARTRRRRDPASASPSSAILPTLYGGIDCARPLAARRRPRDADLAEGVVRGPSPGAESEGRVRGPGAYTASQWRIAGSAPQSA